MTTLLAVFSCCSCSQALIRHWPYFLRQEADTNIVIGTEDRECKVPEGVELLPIGLDCYIQGEHLPRRMLNSMMRLLDWEWDALIMAEYDTLILNKIDTNRLQDVASHLAGQFKVDHGFYHNPWVFNREFALKFVEEGVKVIAEGICQEGAAEASPDVFFGRVCWRMKQPVQVSLWTQFTRNSFDCEGDLEKAKVAYLAGIDVIHGCKTEKELNYITT